MCQTAKWLQPLKNRAKPGSGRLLPLHICKCVHVIGGFAAGLELWGSSPSEPFKSHERDGLRDGAGSVEVAVHGLL